MIKLKIQIAYYIYTQHFYNSTSSQKNNKIKNVKKKKKKHKCKKYVEKTKYVYMP